MSLTSYLAAPPRDYKMITPSGVRGKLRAVITQCKENVGYFRLLLRMTILGLQWLFRVEFLGTWVSYQICPFFWQPRNLFRPFSSYYH